MADRLIHRTVVPPWRDSPGGPVDIVAEMDGDSVAAWRIDTSPSVVGDLVIALRTDTDGEFTVTVDAGTSLRRNIQRPRRPLWPADLDAPEGYGLVVRWVNPDGAKTTAERAEFEKTQSIHPRTGKPHGGI